MRRAIADRDETHELNIATYSKGDELFVAGRYREALSLFKAALKADPSDGDALHAIGSCHDALGEPAKAAAAYRSAISLLPPERHPDLHFNIGNAHLDLGQYAEALEQYALVPKYSSIWPATEKNTALALQRQSGEPN